MPEPEMVECSWVKEEESDPFLADLIEALSKPITYHPPVMYMPPWAFEILTLRGDRIQAGMSGTARVTFL